MARTLTHSVFNAQTLVDMAPNFVSHPTLQKYGITSYASLTSTVKDICSSIHDKNPEFDERDIYNDIDESHMEDVDFDALNLVSKVESAISSFFKSLKSKSASSKSGKAKAKATPKPKPKPPPKPDESDDDDDTDASDEQGAEGADVVDEETGEVVSCPPASAYHVFLAKARKENGPGTEADMSHKDIMKTFGAEWNSLPADEKKELVDAHKSHKERYIALGGKLKKRMPRGSSTGKRKRKVYLDLEVDENAGKDVVDKKTDEVVSCPANSAYLVFLAAGREKEAAEQESDSSATKLSAKEVMKKYADEWRALGDEEKDALKKEHAEHVKRFKDLGGVFKARRVADTSSNAAPGTSTAIVKAAGVQGGGDIFSALSGFNNNALANLRAMASSAGASTQENILATASNMAEAHNLIAQVALKVCSTNKPKKAKK